MTAMNGDERSGRATGEMTTQGPSWTSHVL
jgi:hypothetical protein